jgi:transaldolase
MRKAGISNYEDFAKEIPDRSNFSFAVFADDFVEMERQARRIAPWGKQVSVKILISNTKRETSSAIALTTVIHSMSNCAARASR